MSVEDDVRGLKARVTRLERDRDDHAEKITEVLQAVVDMHGDLSRLERRLPDIIARAVAPLLTNRED